MRSLGPKHDLADVSLRAVTACPGCGYVLFGLPDGSFAMICLTWGSELEQPARPEPRLLAADVDVDRAMAQHEH